MTVPEGVDNEQQIRLAGEGAPGENGGPQGDLYVVFRVKPSETLKEMATIFTFHKILVLRKQRLVKSRFQP